MHACAVRLPYHSIYFVVYSAPDDAEAARTALREARSYTMAAEFCGLRARPSTRLNKQDCKGGAVIATEMTSKDIAIALCWFVVSFAVAFTAYSFAAGLLTR